MELRHLRYFAALAQHMNFTLAAKAVHVAQSTLSHQIMQLEEELGAELFTRVRGRVIGLTAAGSTFSTYAENALREVDEGIWSLKADAGEKQGSFRIATTQAANMVQIPRCVLGFLERFPRVHVSVQELSNDAVFQAVFDGEVDFGVCNATARHKSLHFEHLYGEELMLVVARSHPLARRKTIRMVELHRQPMVLLTPQFATRRMLDEHFRSANAQPDVVIELDSIPPALEILAGGTLASILPGSAHDRNDLVSIPIESPTPMRNPGMAWRKDCGSRPFVRAFADLVRRTAKQEGEAARLRPRRTRGTRR
jgi:LysR family cyn operon transcriptional activator